MLSDFEENFWDDRTWGWVDCPYTSQPCYNPDYCANCEVERKFAKWLKEREKDGASK